MKITKISTKIWAGFIAILLIMAFIATFSYIQLNTLNNKVVELRDRRVKNIMASESLALNSARQAAATRGYLATGNEKFITDLDNATKLVEEKMSFLNSNTQNKEKLAPFKDAVDIF